MSWINRLAVACIIVAAAVPVLAESPQPADDLTRLPLAALISQSEELGLPTKFLRDLPPEFVTVTFEAVQGKTLIRLVESGFATEEQRLGSENGWPAFLTSYERFLTTSRDHDQEV